MNINEFYLWGLGYDIWCEEYDNPDPEINEGEFWREYYRVDKSNIDDEDD